MIIQWIAIFMVDCQAVFISITPSQSNKPRDKESLFFAFLPKAYTGIFFAPRFPGLVFKFHDSLFPNPDREPRTCCCFSFCCSDAAISGSLVQTFISRNVSPLFHNASCLFVTGRLTR